MYFLSHEVKFPLPKARFFVKTKDKAGEGIPLVALLKLPVCVTLLSVVYDNLCITRTTMDRKNIHEKNHSSDIFHKNEKNLLTVDGRTEYLFLIIHSHYISENRLRGFVIAGYFHYFFIIYCACGLKHGPDLLVYPQE